MDQQDRAAAGAGDAQPVALLPCPFCGRSDLLGVEPHPEGEWLHVKCRTCGAGGPTARGETEPNAVANWHRRAPTPPAAPKGEQAEALFRFIAHGDEKHRAWLQAAARAFFAGEPRPDPDTPHPAAGQAEQAPEPMTRAATDVLAERQRQISAEGWTPEHDDEHASGEMALAASCYAAVGLTDATLTEVPAWWPRQWDSSWWKPKDHRRNLVRAGALLLAEIERLDRRAAAEQTKATKGQP